MARPNALVGMLTSGELEPAPAAIVPGAVTVECAVASPGTLTASLIGVPFGTRLWYVNVNVLPSAAEIWL
jgi:hypothetical protein